jgi:hypothetical protein
VFYAVKPTDMDEAFGCLWPDGAPLVYYETEVEYKITYREKDGKTFSIAYTIEQMQNQCEENGYFCPYAPLVVTTLCHLSSGTE